MCGINEGQTGDKWDTDLSLCSTTYYMVEVAVPTKLVGTPLLQRIE